MPHSRNVRGRGSGGKGRGRVRSSVRGGNNKIHNINYNSKAAKDSGGKRLKGFEVDNAVIFWNLLVSSTSRITLLDLIHKYT